VVAERERCLGGQQQAVTGDVARVLVGRERLARHVFEAPEPPDRLFNLLAAGAHQIGIERHDANASFVARRSTGFLI